MRGVLGGQLRRFASGYDVVRHVVAAVLIAAALLKAHQAATDPIARAGVRGDGPLWFQIALVQLELFFAAWLLSNLYPAAARRAAIGLFGAFAAVSLYRLLAGRADCGCFGNLTVHPALTLAIDLLLCGALWRYPASLTTLRRERRPSPDTSSEDRPMIRRHFPTVLIVLALAASVLLSFQALTAEKTQSVLQVDHAIHDFGTVTPGLLKHTFVLTNRTKHPINVLRTVTGCGCTSAILSGNNLAPGKSVEAVTTVDVQGRNGPFSSFFYVVYHEVGQVPTEEAQVACLLKANVEAIVQVIPAQLTFVKGRSETKQIRIAAKAAGITFKTAEPDHRALITAISRDGQTADVSFDSRQWADGEGSAAVQLETSWEPAPSFHVPVHVILDRATSNSPAVHP